MEEFRQARSRGKSRGRPQTTSEQPLRLHPRSLTSTEPVASTSSQESEAGALRGRGGLRGAMAIRPTDVGPAGDSGANSIKLITNFFKLLLPSDQIVYQYHVNFEPEILSVKVRRGLMTSNSEIFGRAFVFDGTADLKTLNELPEDKLTLTSVTHRDNTIVTITLKPVKKLAYGSNEMIRCYNTQMRKNLIYLEFMLIGRYFYNKTPIGQLSDYDGINVHQGALTAINDHECGILMTCDPIFKCVRKNCVDVIIRNLVRSTQPQLLKNAVRREFTGAIVMTHYNNKTYRVEDVDFDKNPLHSFESSKGSQTYIEYYQSHYQIQIKDYAQPLLLCLPSERYKKVERQHVYLIPELCVLTGLTEKQRQDFKFGRKLSQLSRLEPADRVNRLNDFMSKLLSNEKVESEMRAWNIGFERGLLEVPAKILAKEKLVMGPSFTHSASNLEITGDFFTLMQNKMLIKSIPLENWMLIYPTSEQRVAITFQNALKNISSEMRIPVSKPADTELNGDRTNTYLNAFHQLSNVNFIVCIVPNNQKDRYDSIKRILCCEKKIPSQVIVSRSLSDQKKLKPIVTKVLIQIVCKLGGQPWGINIPVSILISLSVLFNLYFYIFNSQKV